MAKFEISIDDPPADGKYDVGVTYLMRAYCDEGYGGAKAGDNVSVWLEHSGKSSIRLTYQQWVKSTAQPGRLYMGFYWKPEQNQIGSWTVRGNLENTTGYKSTPLYVTIEGEEETWFDCVVYVKDENGDGIGGAEVLSNDNRMGYTDAGTGRLGMSLPAGEYYFIRTIAPEGYECVDCSEGVTMTGNKTLYFSMKGDPTGTCNLRVVPSDQDGMQVDATLEMNNIDTGATETKRTYADQSVTFVVNRGEQYRLDCSSERCDDKSVTFAAPDTANDSLYVRMACEIKPKAAYVTAYVKEVGADVMSGVDVTLAVTGGETETKQTSASGAVTFQILHGDAYTITAAAPAEYTCNCDFCICSDTGVGDSSYNPKYPFRMMRSEDVDPGVLTLAAPANVVQYKEFFADVSGAPISKEIHVYRDDAIWKDKSLGSGVAGGDGKTTIKCITEVSGNIKLYACYKPGLTKCELESARVNVYSKESDKPDAIETAIFTNVDFEKKLRHGDDVSVTCDIENTGTDPCELVLRLYDGGGALVDENPNGILAWYFTLGVGKTIRKNVSTASHPLHNMPDHDIEWSVGLDELKKNDPFRTVQETHVTVPIVIAIDRTYAEGGEFVGDLSYPKRAHHKDEIDVGFKIKNTGDKTSELYVKLWETDTSHVINTEPDILKKIVKPGDTWEDSITTHWHWGAMPEHDWNLALTLWEYDPGPEWLNPDDMLDEKRFTIVFAEDDEFIAGDLTLKIAGLAMSGDVDVSGEGPADARVHFLTEQSFLGIDILAEDTDLGSTMIDADGKYATTILLDSFGSAKVYAKIKKGWTWMEWIVKDDIDSKKHKIFIMTWTVVIATAIGLGLMLEWKYGKLGLFGAKKRRAAPRKSTPRKIPAALPAPAAAPTIIINK